MPWKQRNRFPVRVGVGQQTNFFIDGFETLLTPLQFGEIKLPYIASSELSHFLGG